MMNHYSVYIELDSRTYAGTADLLDVLNVGGFHAAVGFSPRGWLDVTLTVPADSLLQATQIAVAVVQQHTALEAIRVEVMTDTEFDARQGFETIPDLVSVTEAAELLGVSRARVKQLVNSHQLTGTMVGSTIVIGRAEVEARIAKQKGAKE